MPEVFNLNADSSLMSKEQIIADLKNRLDQRSLFNLKTMPEEYVLQLHHTLGKFIRNGYGLWVQDNPHLPEGETPDDFSMDIIKDFRKELNTN